MAETGIGGCVHGTCVSHPEIRVSVELITPEVAAEMLGRNTHNRHLSGNVRAHRGNIYLSMANDEWRLNGESIKFGRDGTLLDGQHRLAACVESGHAFETLVVRGLDPRSQDVMDSGRKRTVSDVVTMGGTKRAQIVSAAALLVINYANAGMFPKSGIATCTREGQIRFVRRNEDELLRAVKLSVRERTSDIIQPATATACAFILSRVSEEDVREFFDDLAGLSQRHQPVAALRSTLANHRIRTGKKADRQTAAALTIKAWNAYMDGVEIKRLAWSHGGVRQENFPEVEGMTDKIRAGLLGE